MIRYTTRISFYYSYTSVCNFFLGQNEINFKDMGINRFFMSLPLVISRVQIFMLEKVRKYA